jgi:glycosyltransferase involved in cell wall biosynthesis
VFLRAIAQLDRADIRAYVIGGPVYQTTDSQWSESELRGLVAELGLQDRVGFTGFIEDMPGAYRALDVVVHASTRPEPFGLVIAEAMACGRAVIAAPAGGAGELFVHDEHALAAPAGDPAGLAKSLRLLIDDRERRATLGARARAHVVERFGGDRFATNLRAALAGVGPEQIRETAR